jgi:hypothetical integral membrane protein (TIGR02206 family)
MECPMLGFFVINLSDIHTHYYRIRTSEAEYNVEISKKRGDDVCMFSVTEMRDFTFLSTPHIVTLVLFFLTYVAMIYFRKSLIPYQSILKWTLFSILVLCEVSHHLWLVLTHTWDVSALPIQLCSLSTFIALYLFIKNNKKAFYLFYFIGTIPPILSMVTPDIIYWFPHYRFLKYFLHHAAIPLAVLYFILFEGYRVHKKTILSSFLILNIIAVPVFFLNIQLGTNFFFLAKPSEQETLLSFFGSGIIYYINLEIVALLVFVLTYIPIGILQKKEKERSEG